MMICKLVVILRVHKGIIPFFYQNENLYGFIVISDFKKRRNLKMAEIENVNKKANVGVTLGGVGLGVASKLDIRFDEAPFTPEMFRAAIHIQYYDCAVPLKKSGKDMSATDWGRMADFYFTADDEDGSRLVDYYFQKMRNKLKKAM